MSKYRIKQQHNRFYPQYRRFGFWCYYSKGEHTCSYSTLTEAYEHLDKLEVKIYEYPNHPNWSQVRSGVPMPPVKQHIDVDGHV